MEPLPLKPRSKMVEPECDFFDNGDEIFIYRDGQNELVEFSHYAPCLEKKYAWVIKNSEFELVQTEFLSDEEQDELKNASAKSDEEKKSTAVINKDITTLISERDALLEMIQAKDKAVQLLTEKLYSNIESYQTTRHQVIEFERQPTSFVILPKKNKVRFFLIDDLIGEKKNLLNKLNQIPTIMLFINSWV